MIQSKLISKILLLASIIFIYSCSPFKSNDSTTNSWYRTYSGKMGDQEIVLHLTKGVDYKGYLWLKDTQYPVMVYSDPTTTPKEDSIYLNGGNANFWIGLKGIIKGTITGEMTLQINRMQDPVERVSLAEDNSFTPFNFIFTNGNAKLPERLNNQSTYDYFIGTILPSEKTPLADQIENHIRELLGMPSSANNISGWIDSVRKSSAENWKAEGEKLTSEDATIMGLSFSEQVLNHIGVMYENEETITIANYVYVFKGGAHGNYHTKLLNIDKATGKKLILEDVLNPEGIKALPTLLDQAARKRYNIKNENSLEDNGFFVNTLLPGKNFYITAKGIGFYYAPYEIKPFADGEINLMVPKDALKDYWIR